MMGLKNKRVCWRYLVVIFQNRRIKYKLQPLGEGGGCNKWQRPFALHVTQTCDSAAAFLIWVSGLLHPGENLSVRSSFGVLLLWPPGRCALRRARLRQLWVRGCLTGAATKPSDITQRLTEDVLLLLLLLEVVCGAVFLHFHEKCTGPPLFDLLAEHWQPNVTWQVSREPRASGLRGSRRKKEKLRQNQGGDRMIHLINSIVSWHE